VRSSPAYPKRLIEVDLPIKRISAHARREKDMRRGHIPLLHIYPAARPPAACRAVICAALWPDPADPLCPQAFREAAAREMVAFAKATQQDSDIADICDKESWGRYGAMVKRKEPFDLKTLLATATTAGGKGKAKAKAKAKEPTDLERLRGLLLDFIADFAAWEASTEKTFLKTARALTQAAHEALGGAPGTRPLVVDPFAGGGAIPLEALRVGADAFASDLNPVAVLLNKVVLEYIPKYGQRLADEVRKWGQWIKEQAQKELAEFYPKDPDGAMPIAYLWARTINCEGPGCGAEVPLVRSFMLARKGKEVTGLKIVPRGAAKRVDFTIVQGKAADISPGTTRRGSATCPLCGYTARVESVRSQLRQKNGGASSARLLAVVTTRHDERGRSYRLPTERDLQATRRASQRLAGLPSLGSGHLSAVPDEPTSHYHSFVNRGPIYGMAHWYDYFTPRQLVSLAALTRLVRESGSLVAKEGDVDLAKATQAVLALMVDKIIDMNASLCVWQTHAQIPAHVFGRWAIPMVFDFAEANPMAGSSGSPESAGKRTLDGLRTVLSAVTHAGIAAKASATAHPLPDDSAHLLVTDPPYYYSVQYADLMDFFYVWLRRMLDRQQPELFGTRLIERDDEIIVQSPGHAFAPEGKNNAFYEARMKVAMEEGRRVLAPLGVGVVVFAHTSTSGWEALLQSLIDAGWTTTGSWPIDTEMGSRVIAQGRSVLASSVHIVCRPRENPDGSLRTAEVGDWREVLAELPKRIHEWMPRLAREGIVGADAIFACLGPALEIFSRYSRVEKASGEQVTLREYLEHVWGAVAQEALGMIFKGADATGFEEDARLTAMWLWTLSTGNGQGRASAGEDEEAEGESGTTRKKKANGRYVLEFDAARKIAQGLGAHLENLASVVAVEGETARLLSVADRTAHLFGKDEAQAPAGRRKKDRQMKLGFEEEVERAEAEGGWGAKGAPKVGETTLDRVHQAMILFAAGRSEALRRFLVEEGVGRDGRFWTLAQALSALYPSRSDEKRWVDGVLARKKGLGL